jgi:hypothetical protein
MNGKTVIVTGASSEDDVLRADRLQVHLTDGCVLRRRAGQIDRRRTAEAGHHGAARGIPPMTARVNPRGPVVPGEAS